MVKYFLFFFIVMASICETTLAQKKKFHFPFWKKRLATSFTFSTNEDCMENPFSFSGSATTPITSWLWNFGDGGTSIAQNPTHIYTTPGQFVVTLTVTDVNGCCDVSSQLVSVTPSTATYNQNCCSQNVTYVQNPTPPVGMGPFSFEITGTQTNPFPFNQPLPIKDTVIIRSTAVCTLLTITQMFGPWGRIIVERGATLVLGNSTLTGLAIATPPCADVMWQGIEVWGDASKPQSASFQGRLIMLGTQIQKAHNAVVLGRFCKKPIAQDCPPVLPPLMKCEGEFMFGYGGGILDAQSSGFNRNAHNIRVAPYVSVPLSFASASKINQSSFFGGGLFDPGYRFGAASYQYGMFPANLSNPFYAPANPVGRAHRFAQLWKIRGFTFTDNLFQNAERGIELIDATCRVLKNTNPLGNRFFNMNRAINAPYINSTFLGNIIDGNTFQNTFSQTSTIPLDPAAIYINAGKGDVIKNNKFNIVPPSTTPEPMAFNRHGIYFVATKSFSIHDNEFRQNYRGIFVHSSGPGGGPTISQLLMQDGNFFATCSTSVFTGTNNLSLKIQCNTTFNNDPAQYFRNWDNIGVLAQQGTHSGIGPNADKTKPAGNQFDFDPVFQLGGTRREICSNTSYLYYAHSSPLRYVPFPQTSLGCTNPSVDATSVSCPVHQDCCLGDDCALVTNPACRIGNIQSLESQLVVLKQEYNTVLVNLDKGQTTQLISAINQNSPVPPGQLKNILLDASPLSDEVLLAFINRNVAQTPPGIFKDVMLPNSPVSENVLLALEAKLNTLPPGIVNQIKTAQGNSARTLTAITRDIAVVENDRQIEISKLISIYAEMDSIQQIINLLEQENTVYADQTLLASYLADSNLTAAQAKLSSMTAANADEQAYLDLQTLLLNLALQGRTVFEMDSAEEQFVRALAANDFNLASANACAILYLVFGEECTLPVSSNKTMSPPEFSLNDEKTFYGITSIIPNPSREQIMVSFILPENSSSAQLEMYNLLGKKVTQSVISNGARNLNIDLENLPAGTYLLRLSVQNRIYDHKKVVVIK